MSNFVPSDPAAHDQPAPSDALAQSLVRDLPGAVFRCSHAEDSLLRFEYVSPGINQLLDVSAAELMATTDVLLQRLTEAEHHNLAAAVSAALDQQSGWVWTMEYDLPSGMPVWLEWRAQMLSPGTWNGIIVDITSHMHSATRRRGRRERYQQTLVDLAKNPELNGDDQHAAFRSITETMAKVMPVARSSIWLYNAEHTTLECVDLYISDEDRHSVGTQISAADFPRYFEALRNERLITANNAHTHPATAEFSEIYLKPAGIDAMLDAPIRLGSQMVGVLCQEHTQGLRNWAASEESFANSMADLVALVLENQRRRQAEQERSRLQEQVIAMQQAALAELSTPIIPLNNNIILLPLIGRIDAERAQQIIDVLLDAVSTHQSQIVIMDLTGVPVVDTAIASALLRAAQSVRLLGAETVITGIRPEIAQTLVSLGIDLNDLITHSDLQNGISFALARQGKSF